MSNLIWSAEGPFRYLRHILFWLVIYAFLILSVYVSFLTMESFKFVDLLPRFKARFFQVLICAGYTYLIAYNVLPEYLKNRNKLLGFLIKLISLTIVAYLASAAVMYYSTVIFKKSTQLAAWWIVSMNFLLFGPPVVCSLFLACKMLKTYYEKMEEKVSLLRENAEAELQQLKAQVHPHFLFNTLNNIYSFTITKSSQASQLITKLSDMLGYMTSECERALVPLHQELKMLSDYIDLEKVRYGDRLMLNISIKGSLENKEIAPLLLIPFVENSFKHGSSKMLERPWISLDFDINENFLRFSIENSKPKDLIKHGGESGIGLRNVRKRLALLYPDNHAFSIRDTGDTFSVHIELPLHLSVRTNTNSTVETTTQNPHYA